MSFVTADESRVDPASLMEAYRPFVTVRLDSGRYVVKTITNTRELRGALALRSEVFREEYGVDGEAGEIWDVDELDFMADHLVLIDKPSDKVIGTYRLICSERSDRFYSQGEFDLSGLLASPGVKLELSRACMHPKFRGGLGVMLLWRGIGHYLAAVNATMLLGCSSFRTEDPRDAAELRSYFLRTGKAFPEYGIAPLPDSRVEGLAAGDEGPFPEELSVPIPPLAQAYLKAGARFAPEPAHDPAFHCLDFFTVLPVDAIHERYARKYTGI